MEGSGLQVQIELEVGKGRGGVVGIGGRYRGEGGGKYICEGGRDKRVHTGGKERWEKCIGEMDTTNVNHTETINVHRVLSINSMYSRSDSQ